MKKLFTILGLSLGVLGFAQESNFNLDNAETTVSNIAMEVTVDSVEDLESTFKMKDLKEMLEFTGSKDMTFKLTCRGELMSNGKFSTMSYEVEKGEMSDKQFIRLVKELRKSAIEYFKNK